MSKQRPENHTEYDTETCTATTKYKETEGNRRNDTLNGSRQLRKRMDMQKPGIKLNSNPDERSILLFHIKS
jgi:hypothetical protein